ncbi:hypothetical protein ACS0TY_018763 [Phlomoides rotata]
MEGFGVHTFTLINKAGKVNYVKFHWKPTCGVKCLLEKLYKLDEAIKFHSYETEKFEAHMVKKLSKKDTFGDSIDEVIGICTEVGS